MEIAFHGVRGTIPAPGPETNRYGGNTSCASVRSRGGALLILDAGTGINRLGRALLSTEFARGQGSAGLVITHGHWDHIQGFPFFPPIFIPGNRFTVFGPGDSSEALEAILEGQMNPHFSPLYTMKNLGATIEFSPSRGEGEPVVYADLTLRAHEVPHGATRALAWRIEEAGPPGAGARRAIVYVPDAGYTAGAIPDATIDFYRGADLLVHDCTYSPEDRRGREARGSASLAEAVDAAARAGVARLLLTHYDQDYADDKVDALVARGRDMLDRAGAGGTTIDGAREGLVLTV